MYPDDRKYYKEHEWVKIQGSAASVGISDFAQEALGDIVFVELPEVGAEVSAGDSFAEIESVKSVSPLYAPVSGRVTKVNDDLDERPETINQDPHGAGWIAEMELSDASEAEALMTAAEYEKFLETQQE